MRVQFPLTINSQEELNELFRQRIAREKLKRQKLEERISQLTADNPDHAAILDAVMDIRDAAAEILEIIQEGTP